jgi:hypothetical protein
MTKPRKVMMCKRAGLRHQWGKSCGGSDQRAQSHATKRFRRSVERSDRIQERDEVKT